METLDLAEISPIRVWDNEDKVTWSIPHGSVLTNIPVLWKILDQIVQDWKSVANKYRLPVSVKSDDDKLTLLTDALEHVKPRFIHCLFSYITFFFMLENGYHFVYSELNGLNRELDLRLSHGKPPGRTEFIKRLWKIRNLSIAHWAGMERKNHIDSAAGRSWGMSFSASGADSWVWDIEQLQTLISRISRHDETTGTTEISPNLSTKPIPEMHRLCSLYHGQWDKVCASYLSDIKSELPITLNDRQYVGSK